MRVPPGSTGVVVFFGELLIASEAGGGWSVWDRCAGMRTPSVCLARGVSYASAASLARATVARRCRVAELGGAAAPGSHGTCVECGAFIPNGCEACGRRASADVTGDYLSPRRRRRVI